MNPKKWLNLNKNFYLHNLVVCIRRGRWLIVVVSSFCQIAFDIFQEKDDFFLFFLSRRSKTRRKRSQELSFCCSWKFYPWRKPKLFTQIQVRHWRGCWRKVRYALLGSWWSSSRWANRWQSSCLINILVEIWIFFRVGGTWRRCWVRVRWPVRRQWFPLYFEQKVQFIISYRVGAIAHVQFFEQHLPNFVVAFTVIDLIVDLLEVYTCRGGLFG